MIGQADVLKECDVKNVLNHIKTTDNPQRNRIIFLLSYLCGLRVCSIRALTVASCYDSNGKVLDTIVLSKAQNKGSKVGTVYLNDSMKKELSAYYKFLKNDRPNLCLNDFLIQSKKTGKCMHKGSIVRLFRQIYDAVGLFGCRSHSGRRSFITNMAQSGISPFVISKLANHSSLNITMRYVQQTPETLKNAVNVLKI